ncbi:hypothetical protein Y032_0119g811 [Ancylostoma ceylanicum]|uniref:Secreted protein n=1 Tax=Ancylostoma ceylanicum TaxID=53326 RepID=A0A016TB03_9BILA|nr:hypothetical protein Y032_0119g811 [Ancylostoma ceylanicum]
MEWMCATLRPSKMYAFSLAVVLLGLFHNIVALEVPSVRAYAVTIRPLLMLAEENFTWEGVVCDKLAKTVSLCRA